MKAKKSKDKKKIKSIETEDEVAQRAENSAESAEGVQQKKKKSSKAGQIAFKLITLLIFLAGVALLMYPSLGNIISCTQQHQVIEEYEKQVAEMRKNDVEHQKKLAVDYNNMLSTITLQDPFMQEEEATEAATEQSLDDYYEMLQIGSDNMMGYIKIPQISISIPIYHDATEVQLQKGIGHLKGTSLPIGGESTHCVLSGHTGVPGNMLFTDLDKMEIGDKFYLHVLDEVLAYRVDQIMVVDPDDTSQIQIVPGKDYCTLLTCTPYGINSHRLLVRGERTTYIPGEDDDNMEVIEVTDEQGNVIDTKVAPKDYIEILGIRISMWVAYILLPICVLVLIFLILMIVRHHLRHTAGNVHNKKKRKDKNK